MSREREGAGELGRHLAGTRGKLTYLGVGVHTRTGVGDL